MNNETSGCGTWVQEHKLRLGQVVLQARCECGWVGSATYSRETADAECVEHKPEQG